MITRRAVLLGGAVGGVALAAPADADRAAVIRIQHSSGQYSDSRAEHAHDAHALFAHARQSGAAFVSGTEAGHNSLRWQIPRAARNHGYACRVAPGGTWIAVAHWFGPVSHWGVVPVFPRLTAPARLGGHGPEGIVWARVRPLKTAVAPLVTFGAGHWLTPRSLRASGIGSNRRMARAVGRWAREHGQGRALVFYAADSNEHDNRTDVFDGAPLTTCWDELGKWPRTRNFSCLDVIASRDSDTRVSCLGARVDRGLVLFSDHRTISAAYAVAR